MTILRTTGEFGKTHPVLFLLCSCRHFISPLIMFCRSAIARDHGNCIFVFAISGILCFLLTLPRLLFLFLLKHPLQ